MTKFKDQLLEFRAFIISLIVSVVGFLATAFLFWFNRYDVPLAVLTSGLIVTLSWLFLYLNKKKEKPNLKLDIVLIYLRLTLIVILAIVFIVLELTLSLVTVSPVFLVVSYLAISLLTLFAYIGRRENV